MRGDGLAVLGTKWRRRRGGIEVESPLGVAGDAQLSALACGELGAEKCEDAAVDLLHTGEVDRGLLDAGRRPSHGSDERKSVRRAQSPHHASAALELLEAPRFRPSSWVHAGMHRTRRARRIRSPVGRP